MTEHAIIRTLKEGFPTFTPTGKRIAAFMLANPHQLPFETADSIARATQTTGVSVGRFLRQIGFRNLDDLKQKLRHDQGLPWVQTDRLDAFQQRKGENDALKRSLKLELEAIQHVYQLATTPEFARIADRIAQAQAVFVVGMQATRGMAHSFFVNLEYIRPRVYFADGTSGAFVESLNSGFESSYTILMDFRTYASMTRWYCEAAARRHLPLLLVTDFYCPWARDYPIDLLQLKTEVRQFWDTYSALVCLHNLLMSAVVERVGPELGPRLAQNKDLQRELKQFEL